MKLLQNILVATDFSDSSLKAVDASIQMAKKFNSKISLLHVYCEDDFSQNIEDFMGKVINEKLEELKVRIEKSDVNVSEIIIEKGVAFEKIIDVAQDKDVNVIVVGSGNKAKDDNFKLGTTVEKLMQEIQIPLWVVKNEDIKPIQKILCPVDFSDASKRALLNAVTLAEKFNAELNIVHVFEPVMVTSARLSVNPTEENKKRRESRQKELTEFMRNFDLNHINFNSEILMGVPFVEILRAIKRAGSDLLIMGTTGKSIISKLLMGSVTEKVTRELPCSFMTTKAKDITDNFLESNLRGMEGILNSAKEFLDSGQYEEAIEKYLIGIRQYPDNIPMLKGMVSAYKALGNSDKVNYYQEYIKAVIKRIWGDDLESNLKT